MNKISEFFKMYSEISFSSSVNVEDAISAVRENTNLKPDMYLKKRKEISICLLHMIKFIQV